MKDRVEDRPLKVEQNEKVMKLGDKKCKKIHFLEWVYSKWVYSVENPSNKNSRKTEWTKVIR